MHLPSERGLGQGLVAGILHVAVVAMMFLWLTGGIESRYFFSTDTVTLVWAYITLLGAFLTGMVPATLYVDKQLIAPGILVLSIFCLASYATYTAGHGTETWVGPLPLTGYLLLWFVILPIAVISGGLERTLKSYTGR